MVEADYIPEDYRLCERCIFWLKCPYEYRCKTYERTRIAEWLSEKDEDVCDGNSTEKVR